MSAILPYSAIGNVYYKAYLDSLKISDALEMFCRAFIMSIYIKLLTFSAGLGKISISYINTHTHTPHI